MIVRTELPEGVRAWMCVAVWDGPARHFMPIAVVFSSSRPTLEDVKQVAGDELPPGAWSFDAHLINVVASPKPIMRIR